MMRKSNYPKKIKTLLGELRENHRVIGGVIFVWPLDSNLAVKGVKEIDEEMEGLERKRRNVAASGVTSTLSPFSHLIVRHCCY